eukprot:TRINITY_DN14017_c0_g1_i1.p1 TRINITY_DN14017_c0_g1~~TRINITY_DN14017_c0_g1_i1.p1  ORF type:complete len:100 (-),score=19.94 TRINITY_DN14017_c0_g1_i1:112-411(-)
MCIRDSDKPLGKLIFAVFAEIVIIVLFFISESRLKEHSEKQVNSFSIAFFVGIALDLFILDMVILSTVKNPLIKNIIRFRGFYAEHSGLTSSIQYKLIQ